LIVYTLSHIPPLHNIFTVLHFIFEFKSHENLIAFNFVQTADRQESNHDTVESVGSVICYSLSEREIMKCSGRVTFPIQFDFLCNRICRVAILKTNLFPPQIFSPAYLSVQPCLPLRPVQFRSPSREHVRVFLVLSV
jgi:hypothetical protein